MKNQKFFCIVLCDNVIPDLDQGDHLGVTVSNNATFQSHLAKARRKAMGVSRMIARHIRSRDPEILKMMWQIFVEPILNFGSPMWNSGFKYVSQNLDRVCNSYWYMLGVERPNHALNQATEYCCAICKFCSKF